MSRFVWPAAFTATLLASTVALVAQRAPAATQTRLPPEILGLACAPVVIYGEPPTPLRVTGGQDSSTRRSYAPGDLVTVNAGSVNGISVGQEFYVRRLQVQRGQNASKGHPITVHTAGWLKIYAIDDTMSLATVTHACDTIDVDDYLEPFKLPDPVTAASNKPKPERDHYATVMAGTDLRHSFATGDFFTINRGMGDGVKVGAQFVVYRNKGESRNFLFELGEAVAVNVGQQVTTMQVTLARDAFLEGDLVAERKGPN